MDKKIYLHTREGDPTVFAQLRTCAEVREHFIKNVGDLPCKLPESFEKLRVEFGRYDEKNRDWSDAEYEVWIWQDDSPDGVGCQLDNMCTRRGWLVEVDGKELHNSMVEVDPTQ